MPKRSSKVEQLPPDILEKLQELLRDPRVTQLDATKRINAILAERGEDLVSKSGVNRYAIRMNKVGEKMQQCREITEMWIGKLGAAPQGKVGTMVNEILRTLSFDLALVLQRGDIDREEAPAVARMLKEMAIAQERLERAASENVKREEEIRKQERERALQAVDEAEASGGPMTAERLREIIRGTYGV